MPNQQLKYRGFYLHIEFNDYPSAQSKWSFLVSSTVGETEKEQLNIIKSLVDDYYNNPRIDSQIDRWIDGYEYNNTSVKIIGVCEHCAMPFIEVNDKPIAINILSDYQPCDQCKNKTKVQIPIEYIEALVKARHDINQLNLEDIELTEGEKVIPISKECIDAFDFTGLSNIDFFTGKYYTVDDSNTTEEDIFTKKLKYKISVKYIHEGD